MPAIQVVTPRASGSATTAPITPPAARRPPRSRGAPVTRCQTASTATPSRSAPTTLRGRVSGDGSVRRRMTATPSRTTGRTRAAAPMIVRRPMSRPAPTGPPAPHHTPAAVRTASTTSPRATPSRRWAASTSRARPRVRTREPRPRAVSTQPPRSVRTIGPGPPRRAGARPLVVRPFGPPAGRRPPFEGGRCWGDRVGVSGPAPLRRGVRPPVNGRLRDARLSGVSVRPAMPSRYPGRTTSPGSHTRHDPAGPCSRAGGPAGDQRPAW